MRAIENFISKMTVIVGGTILFLMMMQIMIDVFLRQFAGAGFPATAELVSKYYMVAVSFLPIAFTELKRRQVEATIISDMLPARLKPFLLFFGFLLSLFIYGLLGWGTGVEAIRHTTQGAYVETGTLIFYTWPSYWILPVSFGLMALVLLMRIISMLNGTFADHPHNPLEELDSHTGDE